MGKITTAMQQRTSDVSARSSNALIKKNDIERVVCIIDDSSSMSISFIPTTRIEAVADALHLLIDASSRAVTHIGLMTINNNEDIFVDVTDKFSGVKSAASRLSASGGTVYGPALKRALKLKPHRVILLADGEAGDKQESIRMAYEYHARGIRIDTVAAGDSGVELLKELSEITGGVYSFCGNLAALQDTFLKLETRARLQLEHKS